MTDATASTWLEFAIERHGDAVFVGARGSRKETVRSRSIGHDVGALKAFAAEFEFVSSAGKPLPPALRAKAQEIRQSLLAGEIGELYVRLLEASTADGLLVRFLVSDPDLQRIPWEALCHATDVFGYWGVLTNLWPVRGVYSMDTVQPRDVRGAIKVLAIAPTGAAGLENLQQALGARMATGEVEWIEPIVGVAARIKNLPEQLRSRHEPHVVHFLGHGSVRNGVPSLRMADEGSPGETDESWIPVELFVKEFEEGFKRGLRLVVLEACEGAAPSEWGSAGEIIAKRGADAVVAYLGPVRGHIAQTCSVELYRALMQTGNIAASMNSARRTVFSAHDQSVSALSAILYLRGTESRIFNFCGRDLLTPVRAVLPDARVVEVPVVLQRVTKSTFSLVLGDRWKDGRVNVGKFREKLQHELANSSLALPQGLPMGTLAQWFALHRGMTKLSTEFQRAFHEMKPPPIVAAIAKWLKPGVHTTLLRNPWLELCLAEAHPHRTIWVIQPGEDGALLMRREAGTRDWDEPTALPSRLDLENEIVILRPYRGYTLFNVYVQPLLAEDEYHLRLRELWDAKVMPTDWANALIKALAYRPALLLGLSMLTAHHRLLLRHLFSDVIPLESVAVVDPTDGETSLWQAERNLPGARRKVDVVEMAEADLCGALQSMP